MFTLYITWGMHNARYSIPQDGGNALEVIGPDFGVMLDRDIIPPRRGPVVGPGSIVFAQPDSRIESKTRPSVLLIQDSRVNMWSRRAARILGRSFKNGQQSTRQVTTSSRAGQNSTLNRSAIALGAALVLPVRQTHTH